MNIPLPQGFTMRPATMDDVRDVVDLINAYSMAQSGSASVDERYLRSEWELPHFNLVTDTRVVTAPDGQIVGYIETIGRVPYAHIYNFGRVHPDYQDRGIGRAVLAWSEARARQIAPQAPQGARVTLRQEVPATDSAVPALFCQAGYQPARYFWRMVIEMDALPPAPMLPAGLTLRPYQQGQEERAVLRTVRACFRDHWGYIERPFEEDFATWMHRIENNPNFDPALWFVAVAGDDIAGFALCRPHLIDDPGMGWIDQLGVQQPWRRRGLGLALLQHCFRTFYQHGTHKVGLGVDAGSLTGATRLYEKAGMRAARRYDVYVKELRPGQELGT
jgi:mycothiol synthase